jgi:pimeloyl-ACP methyl ester carboxylesterase
MRLKTLLVAASASVCLMAVSAPTAHGQAPPASAAPAAPTFRSDRISVVVQGTGQDVILIPGLTSSRTIWKATVAANPGYRYHLVQVNGFAGHPAGANKTGPVVEPVANEIARYIATMRLNRPALIGHSMGGTLAMMIAARQPQHVGKVMVVDMLPQPAGLFGGNAHNMGPLANSLRNVLTSTVSGRRLLSNVIGRYGADDPGSQSDPDVVAQAAHELATTDLSPELPRISAPLVVLFATPGPHSPAHQGLIRDYRVGYSGARTAKLRPIPQSGHMIMHDQPARFHEEVKAFLTS